MKCGTEKRGCSKDCAITTKSRSHVHFSGQSTGGAGCIDRKGEMLMHLSSDFWFEDERHIMVVRVDMPDGQQSSTLDGCTNFAYSIKDSAT